YGLFVWSLIISFINVTSLPSNYVFQQVIGVFVGILSIVSVFIKLKRPNETKIAYLIMANSIILSVFDFLI
ncbi:hypothetical protein, partial [Romboutsia sp.]|uniref:hypothetical protein n=1 Tax=Romboutsia sp. TaxID=1965302 RepID=UPI003F397AB5